MTITVARDSLIKITRQWPMSMSSLCRPHDVRITRRDLDSNEVGFDT